MCSSDCFSTGELLQPPWCIWLDHRTKLYKVTLQLCRIKTIMSVSNMLSHLRIFCHIYNVIYLVVKLLLISIKLLYIYFISHYFLILYHFISHYILLNNNKSNCNVPKHSVTVIFYYIFHVKPHLLKTLFQSRLLFDFDDFFTNKNRIKCSFTL
jgi:hypothetical protein